VSSRAWQLRIQDILNAINQIQQRLERIDFETFATNTVLAESIVYQFIVRPPYERKSFQESLNQSAMYEQVKYWHRLFQT
jgi:hypothetical protein